MKVKCVVCDGEGIVTEDVAQAGDQTITESYECYWCGGSGYIDIIEIDEYGVQRY